MGSLWTYDIKAVYMIAFTNFTLNGFENRLRIDVGLTDLQQGKVFTGKMRMICLQMPCFTKDREECDNHFERWIYILKNMEILDRMPWAAQNAVFQRLADIAEVSKLNKEERLEYDHALKRYRDTMNAMTGAEQKGRAEGRLETLKENARRMKADGMPLELIAKYTDLSISEVETLLKAE
jgi:predicted transposase/invertase (TIGR01784 family)